MFLYHFAKRKLRYSPQLSIIIHLSEVVQPMFTFSGFLLQALKFL